MYENDVHKEDGGEEEEEEDGEGDEGEDDEDKGAEASSESSDSEASVPPRRSVHRVRRKRVSGYASHLLLLTLGLATQAEVMSKRAQKMRAEVCSIY